MFIVAGAFVEAELDGAFRVNKLQYRTNMSLWKISKPIGIHLLFNYFRSSWSVSVDKNVLLRFLFLFSDKLIHA